MAELLECGSIGGIGGGVDIVDVIDFNVVAGLYVVSGGTASITEIARGFFSCEPCGVGICPKILESIPVSCGRSNPHPILVLGLQHFGVQNNLLCNFNKLGIAEWIVDVSSESCAVFNLADEFGKVLVGGIPRLFHSHIILFFILGIRLSVFGQKAFEHTNEFGFGVGCHVRCYFC